MTMRARAHKFQLRDSRTRGQEFRVSLNRATAYGLAVTFLPIESRVNVVRDFLTSFESKRSVMVIQVPKKFPELHPIADIPSRSGRAVFVPRSI